MNWLIIEAEISALTHENFTVEKATAMGGGCINSAFLISGGSRKYFVKLNRRSCFAMFSAEANSLSELRKADAIKIPEPICQGVSDSSAYIVMEYIELNQGDSLSPRRLGEQLAALHKSTGPSFGFSQDNWIGSSPQKNDQMKNWVSFYCEQRLQYQMTLAKNQFCSHELIQLGNTLCENLAVFFESYRPEPSLLHGDLWSGNYGYDADGRPVIFDPAVYYGDREADIAMTELFGGFPRDFYDAYGECYLLDEGYPVRKNLYNLYHVLNHFNLFGGGYEQQATSMIKKLLSEVI